MPNQHESIGSADLRIPMLSLGEYVNEHNGKHYPRLQFWQVTDSYFEDGTVSVDLPWRIDERPKAARHYGGEQTYF